MTTGKHAAGNVPDRDAANSANAAGSTPVGSAQPHDTTDPAGAAERGRGWRSDEVVRDQAGRQGGSSGWNSDELVRDQGGNEPAVATGWSGSEVVRDQGESPSADAGGWSGSEVVKDHGDLAAEVADVESPRHDAPPADR